MSSVQAQENTQKGKAVSFRDLFWTGASLLINIGLYVVGGGYVYQFLEDNDIDDSIDSEDQLESIHDEVEEYRTGLLISVAIIWLSVPFMLTHIYCFKLLCESLFTSLISTNKPNSIVDYIKWMYILCFLIFAVLLCLIGIFTFLASYYHWSFVDTSDDTSYTGYYIQFMLLCGVIGTGECANLFLGIIACIPWVLLLLCDLDKVANKDLCCFTWFCCRLLNKIIINLLMLLFIFIVIASCIIGAFDWAPTGFWDVDSGAQYFGYSAIISQILAGLWFIYLSFRTKQINELINEENNNQEYSQIAGRDDA